MFLTWKKSSSVFLGFWSKQENNHQGATTPGTLNGLSRGLCLFSLIVLLGTMTGCGGGLMSQGISGLSATSIAIDAGQSYTFQAMLEGTPRVAWSLSGSGCANGSCGTLSNSTGGSVVYTAPAIVKAQQKVELRAAVADAAEAGTQAIIALSPNPSLAGTALPPTVAGAAYAASLPISGGMAPFQWSVVKGSLPTGLAMDAATGALSGAPAVAGSYSFTVQAADASATKPAAQAGYTLMVAPAAAHPGSTLAITTTTLPEATLGLTYNASIVATGGTAPYACGLVSGSLPTGLALNGCSITGRLLASSGSSFAVRVTDASSPQDTVTGNFKISLTPAPLAFTTAYLTNGTIGKPYLDKVGVLGGTAPYNCSVQGGSLPAGLSLKNCTITGIPSASGSGSVTLQVTDSQSPSATISGSAYWTIKSAALTLVGSMPNGTVGIAYHGSLTASGGVAPYSCSAAGGALPAGLVLNGCSITGTPATAGIGVIALRLNDSASPANTATGNFNIVILPGTPALSLGSLSNGVVGLPYNSSITVTGGKAPYACSLAGGVLPAGLSLNGCSLTGVPTAAGSGSVSVKVTDSSSPAESISQPLSLTIAPAQLVLTTTALPNGTAAVFYTSNIAATGGLAPYSCSITAGTLPAGLSLAGCSVTGTPAAAAKTVLTVRISDAGSPAAVVSGQLSLVIAPPALTLATATLPAATVGQPYAGSLSATGGTAPYSYSISAGSLPAGLVLSSAGAITGTPTTAASSTFTATVTDSGSPQMSATHAFSLAVATPALTLTSTTLPGATAGQLYSATIGVTGGTAPYACSLFSGSLPNGLSLSGCTVSGMPATAGNASVILHATDASVPAQAASGTVTLTVQPPALTIGTASLPAGMVNMPYTGSISVAGGAGAVSCSIAAGAMPAGLQLNGPLCTITGTPTTAGTASLTVVATDTNTPQADTASATLALTVNAATMSLTTTQLATPVLGTPYTQTIGVTGGVAPYTFAVAGGALPQGLSLSASGVLSGTPKAAGASSFTINVADNEATPQTATQMYVPLVTYAAGTNNAQLSGAFAFLVQGYDAAAAGDLPYQTATAGSFVADGSGLVKNGEMDSNHQSSTATGTVPTTHFIGTYEVGADDRGLLTMTTVNSDGTTGTSSTFAIAASAEAPANGSMAAVDIAAAGGSPLQAVAGPGLMLMQDTSTFAQGLKGSYAFGLKGDTPCLATCVVGVTGGPVAEVGQFTTDGAGTIANGTSDSNLGATTNANATLSGSYGAADANGRLQMTMNTANTAAAVYPGDYAVYLVNANEALLMSTDSHATHVLLSGTAQLQTQSTFSNASLSGAMLGYEDTTVDPASLGSSLASVSTAPVATIFRTTATADGNCSISNVDVAGGSNLINAGGSNAAAITALLSARQTTGATNCAVMSNGRGVMTTPQPSTSVSNALNGAGLTAASTAPRVFYLVSPDRGYFLETGYAALGSFEPQAAGPFSKASLSGTYRFGTGAPSSATSTGSSGVATADANGTLVVAPDAGLNATGLLAAGSNQTLTYAVTDTVAGRFSTGTVLMYAISPNRFLQIDVDPAAVAPSVGTMQR